MRRESYRFRSDTRLGIIGVAIEVRRPGWPGDLAGRSGSLGSGVCRDWVAGHHVRVLLVYEVLRFLEPLSGLAEHTRW